MSRQLSFIERDDLLRPQKEILRALAAWVGAIPQLQVLCAVVGSVAVLVMDVLLGPQRAAEELLHDVAMLCDVTPSDSKLDVSAVLDGAASFWDFPHRFGALLALLGIAPLGEHDRAIVAIRSHALAIRGILPVSLCRVAYALTNGRIASSGAHVLSVNGVLPVGLGDFGATSFIVTHGNYSTTESRR